MRAKVVPSASRVAVPGISMADVSMLTGSDEEKALTGLHKVRSAFGRFVWWGFLLTLLQPLTVSKPSDDVTVLLIKRIPLSFKNDENSSPCLSGDCTYHLTKGM